MGLVGFFGLKFLHRGGAPSWWCIKTSWILGFQDLWASRCRVFVCVSLATWFGGLGVYGFLLVGGCALYTESKYQRPVSTRVLQQQLSHEHLELENKPIEVQLGKYFFRENPAVYSNQVKNPGTPNPTPQTLNPKTLKP